MPTRNQQETKKKGFMEEKKMISQLESFSCDTIQAIVFVIPSRGIIGLNGDHLENQYGCHPNASTFIWLNWLKILVFATEMNFLSFLVLEIWGKTCFPKAAILKSKMKDECMGAPKFFLRSSVSQEPMYHVTISHGLIVIYLVLSLQLLSI